MPLNETYEILGGKQTSNLRKIFRECVVTQMKSFY